MEGQDAVQVVDRLSLQGQPFETPVDDPNVGTAGGPGGGDPSHVGGGLDADEPHVTRMVGCKLAQLPACPAADVDDRLVRVPQPTRGHAV